MKIIITIILSFILLIIGIGSWISGPNYKGPSSAHFDGTYFRNRIDHDKTIIDILRLIGGYYLFGSKWPKWVEIENFSSPPKRINRGLSVTFINHASVLIQVDGMNIITDPILSDRASPFTFLGPKRVHRPGVMLEDLPPIDVILISHNHYDHLDLPTLKNLTNVGAKDKKPLILTGLGNKELLLAHDLTNAREMDWEQIETYGSIKFIYVEARHRSGRGFLDQMRTLWGGFVILTPYGNIYFAGDTGYDKHFQEIRSKYAPIILSLLPIGAYEPQWFMHAVHLTPEEAIKAHHDLASKLSVPIHFGTYPLTYEPREEPEERLRKALNTNAKDKQLFLILKPGETKKIV